MNAPTTMYFIFPPFNAMYPARQFEPWIMLMSKNDHSLPSGIQNKIALSGLIDHDCRPPINLVGWSLPRWYGKCTTLILVWLFLYSISELLQQLCPINCILQVSHAVALDCTHSLTPWQLISHEAAGARSLAPKQETGSWLRGSIHIQRSSVSL